MNISDLINNSKRTMYVFISLILCGFSSCTEDEAPTPKPQATEQDVSNNPTRSDEDTQTSDGKVRIGDVVIDTTWDGESNYNF